MKTPNLKTESVEQGVRNFDELYSYDGVNQLVDMQRGKLNVAKDAIASDKNYQDKFTFDATGNYTSRRQ